MAWHDETAPSVLAHRADTITEGLRHVHDAGWVGCAGRTEEDQCPLLSVVRVLTVRFCCLLHDSACGDG